MSRAGRCFAVFFSVLPRAVEPVAVGAVDPRPTLVDPDTDIHASADYRRLLVGVLTERTLAEAGAEAAGRAA